MLAAGLARRVRVQLKQPRCHVLRPTHSLRPDIDVTGMRFPSHSRTFISTVPRLPQPPAQPQASLPTRRVEAAPARPLRVPAAAATPPAAPAAAQPPPSPRLPPPPTRTVCCSMIRIRLATLDSRAATLCGLHTWSAFRRPPCASCTSSNSNSSNSSNSNSSRRRAARNSSSSRSTWATVAVAVVARQQRGTGGWCGA